VSQLFDIEFNNFVTKKEKLMKRSTFKILFYLKSNLKKNGNGVIMGRITVDGEQTQFSTKLEILPEQWNTTTGKACGSGSAIANINRQLDLVRSNITVYYNQLMTSQGYATPQKLKNMILGVEGKEHTIIYYFEKHNEQYKLKVGTSTTWTTYTKYELTKNRLIEFLDKKYNVKDILLREFSTALLQDFYLFLRSAHGSGNNNAMKNLQRLRAVFKYIFTTGYDEFRDPYLGFKMSFEKHSREYLEKKEIDIIYNKKFASKSLERVRDIFIFSCYTGLSYSDIADLKTENIRMAFDNNLWIMGERNKTKVKFNVRLLDIPKDIISKYSKKCNNGNLLPCITNQKMNEYLKEIAQICGINKNITFHVARHTFATLCLTEGVPIESVSKMLGHTDIRTTQIYARIIDQKLSNDMENLALKLNKKEQKEKVS